MASRRILSGFCAEAAVLLAIFPYLDFLVDSRHVKENSSASNGAYPIDMGSVKRVSAMLVVFSLVTAVVLAIKTPGKNEENGEE